MPSSEKSLHSVGSNSLLTASSHASTDTEGCSSESVEAWLEAVSRELDPTECKDFSELGIYSIHEHSSARTITLPEAAEEFDDAATVKQYYFEGEDCPLLIVAPLKI